MRLAFCGTAQKLSVGGNIISNVETIEQFKLTVNVIDENLVVFLKLGSSHLIGNEYNATLMVIN